MEAIDARMFLMMLRGAVERLEAEKERVNALNVFPVPDGDTGTNMALTLRAALEAAEACGGDHVGRLAQAAARGALLGARGNSGVILSQFFRGMAEALKDVARAETDHVVAALESAAKAAYVAVLNPVEGTMLSVGRAGAEAARAAAERGLGLENVLADAYEGARRMLEETPRLLDVLREAGVVDAGGEGLVVAFYGSLGALENGTLAALPVKERAAVAAVTGASSAAFSAPWAFPNGRSTAAHADVPVRGIRVTENITYKYCTEFLVHGTALDPEAIRLRMLGIDGDSLLVVGDAAVVKVHIHTNEPWEALKAAAAFGDLSSVQVGNMVLQNLAAAAGTAQHEAADTHARLPDAPVLNGAATKPVGVVAVVQGEGFRRLLKDLGVDRFVDGGQSMNPSTEEMLAAVEAVTAAEVILLPNNRNVLLAAEQVARLAQKTVHILPTSSLPQAIAAMMAFRSGVPVGEVLEEMRASLAQVRVGEVTWAVRDAKVNGVQVREGQAIGLADGRIVGVGDSVNDAVRALIEALHFDGAEIITLYHGADVSADEARALAREVGERWAGCAVEVYEGGQPVYHYLVTVE